MAASGLQTSAYDFNALKSLLEAAQNDEELFRAVVDAPFQDAVKAASLFLGVVVLLLVDKENGTIDRIAICNTEMAARAKQMSMKKFEDIRIPLNYKENVLAKAIATGESQQTTDWKYLFAPELSEQHARYNQADAGISFSCVHPFTARDGGALIFSFYQPEELIQGDFITFMQNYTELVNAELAR
jgi:hypothetical protein